MVNLLFISSNSRIDTIKNALQPLLKIKIDVVGDFDYGLKEVFEKRPALVLIQDQITGVTGESVARHIQMLLGSDAPLFILLHDDNLKAKPIKGLYNYLIDLSQDVTKVVADIQSALKLLLGPQWENIYIAPKTNKSGDTAGQAVPKEDRVRADQHVEDFITDLSDDNQSCKNKDLLPDVTVPETSSEEHFQVVSSAHDQLDEIIAAAASEFNEKATADATASDHGSKKVSVTSDSATSSVYQAPAATSQQVSAPIVNDEAVVSGSLSTTQAASPEFKSSVTAPIRAGMTGKSPSSPISPADFRIERERAAAEVAVDESMRAFEANYLSKEAARKWYQAIAVVLLLCLAGGGWYLVNQKPHLMQPVAKESTQAIVPAPTTKPSMPVAVIQKTVSTTHKPVTAALPSFIPYEGLDRTFASQKPGWERYVGIDSEFRVFRSAGKLKAVQVLATEGHVISESRLKTILVELTGSGEYRIISKEQKHGFQISRATINRKADLLIYRKKSDMHAFVVSLD